MIKLKGITIMECLVSIVLIASAFVGIYSFNYFQLRKIDNDNYQSLLYNNKYSILTLFDVEPDNFINNLSLEYGESYKKINDKHYIIIPIDFKFINHKTLTYEIFLIENDKYYQMTIYVVDVEEEFKFINKECYAERVALKR